MEPIEHLCHQRSAIERMTWFACPSTSTRSRRCATRAAGASRACSRPLRSASRPARLASPCIRAPIGATSRPTMCGRSRGRCAATPGSRVQHRRRSAARAAGSRRGGAARSVHARAGGAWRGHQPGRLAAGARRPSDLPAVVARLQARGIRVSLFVDPVPEPIRWAASVGADRVELYTEPFARAFETGADDARRSFAHLRGGGPSWRTRSASASTPATISISTNLDAVSRPAAPRRGVDRPRHHVARAVRRPLDGRPRVSRRALGEPTARCDMIGFDTMKSDAIAFGVAGILFGLIAGWIIGIQQAAARPPARRAGRLAGVRLGRRLRLARRGARRDAGQRAQDGGRARDLERDAARRSSATCTSTPSATTMRSSGTARR